MEKWTNISPYSTKYFFVLVVSCANPLDVEHFLIKCVTISFENVALTLNNDMWRGINNFRMLN